MKKLILIAAAALGLVLGNTACQRINEIDGRLTALEDTVSQLKSMVEGGAVITSVDEIIGGHLITLSNGKTFTVLDGIDGIDGIDGKDGKDGKDGEAILADIKIEEYYIILTLKNGEILKISYQNPFTLVTASIMPDYTDGSVAFKYSKALDEESSNILRLNITITPAKYVDFFDNEEDDFRYKANFLKVSETKGAGDTANFSVKDVLVGSVSGEGKEHYLFASISLDEAQTKKIAEGHFMVNFVAESTDDVHGIATDFVLVRSEAVVPTEDEVKEYLPGIWRLKTVGGDDCLTDDQIISTYLKDGKDVFSSIGESETKGWAAKDTCTYTVSKNTLTVKAEGSNHIYTIEAIGETRMFRRDKDKETDQILTRVSDELDYETKIIGLWEGTKMTGDSTYGGYNHRWKFNADGTYNYYSSDGKTDETSTVSEYNVQGDWLAFRWGEEEEDKTYESWDITKLTSEKMVWTATRKDSKGNVFTNSIEMVKVEDDTEE